MSLSDESSSVLPNSCTVCLPQMAGGTWELLITKQSFIRKMGGRREEAEEQWWKLPRSVQVVQ